MNEIKNINLYPFNDLNEKVFTDEGRKEYERNYVPPNFTVKELRDCIPPHLFKKSLLKSSLHMLFHLGTCFILFRWALNIQNLHEAFQWVCWPIYWFLQGSFMTGLWIIGHECGHHAFCDSKIINHGVGYTLHSCLLVPYYSWKISHAKHHASTGHVDEDVVYIPIKSTPENPHIAAYDAWQEAWDTAPLCPLLKILIMLTIGWPLYFFFNTWGQEYPKHTCHFLPSSPIFKPQHARQVIASDIGLIAVLSVLGYVTYTYGFQQVMAYYGIPYLYVNALMITITFLQHTDIYVPHYSSESWSFVRGALTTVDRDFGPFLNWVLFNITDSHVAHHLFSQMPHYHAIEATKYLKEKLGPYYLKDSTNFIYSLYRSMRECQYVDYTQSIMFYKRNNWNQFKKSD